MEHLIWVAVTHMGLDRHGAVIPQREAATCASALVVMTAIRARAKALDAPLLRS